MCGKRNCNLLQNFIHMICSNLLVYKEFYFSSAVVLGKDFLLRSDRPFLFNLWDFFIFFDKQVIVLRISSKKKKTHANP